jgi:hypothetical protein
MPTHDDDDVALETLEQALAAIRRDDKRDENTERVIQAMEDKRAELIASKLRRASAEHDTSSLDDEP